MRNKYPRGTNYTLVKFTSNLRLELLIIQSFWSNVYLLKIFM